MRHKVVLNGDWVVIGGITYLTKLAYAAPGLGRFGDFDFTLPPDHRQIHENTRRKARHSGGLLWPTAGSYYSDQVPQAFASLFDVLGHRPISLSFHAEGRQRCQLLERWLPRVNNLEDLGCPKYQNLTSLNEIPLLKAVTFARRVHSHE